MEFDVPSVLVTGASGFVGQRLVRALNDLNKWRVTSTSRYRDGSLVLDNVKHIRVPTIDSSTDWSGVLGRQEVVIHVAGVAHQRTLTEATLALYHSVNVDGTLNLARQAAGAGVRRFIFVSSIGVNGNHSDTPLKASDIPSPAEPYALSKFKAEQSLVELGQAQGMEVVIIRPPLVYGAAAPGNFAQLVRLVKKGLPLPLGAIQNKRSLVALDNLIDLLITCIDHPNAANQTFLVSDGEDLSTTELLQGVAEAMGKPSRLIPVPAGLLQFGATLLGKEAMAQRLLGSLQVDIRHTKEQLGWKPPLTVKEGLKRCFPDHQE
ncbi:MAG: SDR family oxidoreductase [Gammaproteobacteria bacterium]|nr:SDR family oxidoreductase [Gammaproteobacteria bacterium]